MIYTSLAVFALSASAAISPLSSLVHLHPHVAQADNRVNVKLLNAANTFRDLKIGEKTYTVEPQHVLSLRAPAGTMVYAASRSAFHHRGDAVLEVSPKLNQQTVKLD